MDEKRVVYLKRKEAYIKHTVYVNDCVMCIAFLQSIVIIVQLPIEYNNKWWITLYSKYKNTENTTDQRCK